MVRPTLIDLNYDEPCYNQRHSQIFSHVILDANLMLENLTPDKFETMVSEFKKPIRHRTFEEDYV